MNRKILEWKKRSSAILGEKIAQKTGTRPCLEMTDSNGVYILESPVQSEKIQEEALLVVQESMVLHADIWESLAKR